MEQSTNVNLNDVAIKKMNVFASNIGFGDVDVDTVEYSGANLIIKGHYTEQAIAHQDEQNAQEIYEKVVQGLEEGDEVGIATAVIEGMKVLGIHQSLLDAIAKKFSTKTETSL